MSVALAEPQGQVGFGFQACRRWFKGEWDGPGAANTDCRGDGVFFKS